MANVAREEGLMHDLLGEVLVSRQPILNREFEVVGYELLYRDLDGGHPHLPDGAGEARETASVLDGVLTMGFEELTGGEDAWVKVPGPLLVADVLLDVPPKGLVLEVTGGHGDLDELRAALSRHRAAGFRLALDGVGPDDARAGLTDLVDVVKVDLGEIGLDASLCLVRALAGAGGPHVAVAGVEDPAVFDRVAAAGATLLQGFFFTRPRAVRGVRPLGLAPGHLALLQALAADEVDLHEVERLIRSDLTLSDRFLRLVHAACGWREVESIHHGLVRLGVRAVQRWVALLLLSATTRERTPELVAVASARARGCELLEELRGGDRRLEAFSLGMFSVLGAEGFLAPAVLNGLPLSEDVRAALEDGDGPLRELLEVQLASERADWDRVVRGGRQLGLAPRQLARAHADALAWSTTVKHAAG